MVGAATQGERRRHLAELETLHKQRRAERVAAMEAEQGLT
jgi:hypothetical protein